MNEKIKTYFRLYPQSTEVYECGGLLFHTRGAAESYARGEVTRFTRAECEVEKSTKKQPKSKTKKTK